MNINTMHPRTGRIIREDGRIINQADYIAGLTAGTTKLTINPLPAGTNIIGSVKLSATGTELLTPTTPGIVKDQGELLVTAPVTRIVTITETPVALNSKSSIRQITVKNTDPSIRARIGETGMTPANRKGLALEPGSIMQESFDPNIAVTIYGRSEGAAIEVEVYEA